MAEKKSGHIDGANVTKSEFPQESVQGTENVHLKTRRRLIQVGLMSLPVLMTVRSRPAFAQSLGSVEIPYGAYAVDKDGNFLEDSSGNYIPLLMDDDGLIIGCNSQGCYSGLDPYDTTTNDYKDQMLMMNPGTMNASNRRPPYDTISYKDYIKLKQELEES